MTSTDTASPETTGTASTDTGTGTTPWWIDGNFAPITEELTCEVTEVEGELPSGLSGTYLRNGFNPPGRVPMHWFFGAGMVHGFTFHDGAVAYRNRYVRTPYMEDDLDLMSAMGDPRASPANTNIIRHGGRFLALEEAHLPWELDGGLGTVDTWDFGGALDGPMTAHPKICPQTGELLFFGYRFLSEPYLTYHRADASGRLVQTEVIDLPRPVMMHDFGITRNHNLFLDLPIIFDLSQGGFHFDPAAGARIGVMPREGNGQSVRWFEVEPCSVFHVLNAHEELGGAGGDEIVMYVCRAASLMSGGMNDFGDQAVLWEWRLNLTTGGVTERQLDDRCGDFPRINDSLVGLPARYGYVAGMESATAHPTFADWIVKYDLGSGTETVHSFGPGAQVFEPVFVPAPSATAEDEGWIVVLTHDTNTDGTTLNVLDAQRFADEPVARVHLPQRVPFGAHGNWFGGLTLGS